MGKAERAVGDEVEVEMLTGELIFFSENIEYGEGDQIEADLHLYGGPWNGRRSKMQSLPLTAPLAQASQPAENQCDGHDERKAVAGDLAVSEVFFANFHSEESSDQGTGDGFSCQPVKPSVIASVQPAFGNHIGDFRSEKGTAESKKIDQRELRIGAGMFDPVARAQHNR